MVRQRIANPLFPSSYLGVAYKSVWGRGEMVDTTDLKSVGFTAVRVQVPPPPLFKINLVTYFLVYNELQIKLKSNMSGSYLPAILVPIVGIIFPAFAMALLFIYVEKNEIA